MSTALSLFVLFLMTVSFSFSATKHVPNNDEEFIDLSSNAFLQPDNENTGKVVATPSELAQQNPEELGTYFEGDIRMPSGFNDRNSLLAKNLRWPKNIVPYEIRGNFTVKELAVIDWAFESFHKRTCIRFKPRSRENDFISIVNGDSGCWSAPGRIGGKQEVNLQTPQCVLNRGTILHEFMHVLGFMHEHNRHDRDIYVTIHTENVKDAMVRSFQKLSKKKAHGMGIGYDYTSVMHYSRKSFSKNGQPTIEAKMDIDEAKLMGQRNGFSAADVAKINVMYKCNRKDLRTEEDHGIDSLI